MLKRSAGGFSLVEMLVFVAVVSIFFTIAASVASYLIRNAVTNERKIVASHYSEELMEWLRSEKDVDWGSFLRNANLSNTSTVCFNDLSWSDSCSKIDNLYSRQAAFEAVYSGSVIYQVKVRVGTSWDEARGVNEVPLESIFSVWEPGS